MTGFYDQMRASYGIGVAKSMKDYSTLNEKLAHQVNRRIFLLACRSEGLHPNYLRNGTRNLPTLTQNLDGTNERRLANITRGVRDRLLRLEIRSCCKTINKLKSTISLSVSALSGVLDPVLLSDFIQGQRARYNNTFARVKSVNLSKLGRLRNPVQDTVQTTSEKWIKNRTSVTIPDDISAFLSLGPKFWLPTTPRREDDIYDLLANVEQIVYTAPTEERNLLRARATQSITTHLNGTRGNASRYRRLETRTGRFLRDNPEILITNADKGNVTVVMSRDEYRTKSYELLDDESVYEEISTDPTSRVERKHNLLVDRLVKENHLTAENGKKFRNYNSIAPKYYGLPKVHKLACPLRPIISSTMSPTRPLATFLAGILREAFKDYLSYRVKDSFDFAEQVKDVAPRDGFVVVSFDVVSLFTNIPRDLVMSIITEEWDRVAQHTTIPKDLFLELLTFIFENVYFTYDGKNYRQIQGTPMGSVISPDLAEIVVNFLLRNVIPTLDFECGFVYQYVDDIIAYIPETKVDVTLNILNAFNRSIQFTVEREKDGFVPFLDMKVIRRKNGKIVTDWYQKPTASGRYIHAHSDHPFQYKVNVIKGLKNRVLTLSDSSFHRQNLEILRNIFKSNGYGSALINKILFSTRHRTARTRPPDEPDEGEVSLTFKSLPMITGLTPTLRRLFSPLPVKVAITAGKKVGDFFTNLKDTTDLKSKCNLVYRVDCGDCERCYVGMTGQRFQARINQHDRDITRGRRATALSTHALEEGHSIRLDEPTILTSEKNYHKRAFKEMCYIKSLQNTMNSVTDLLSLSPIYSNLIAVAKGMRTERRDHT